MTLQVKEMCGERLDAVVVPISGGGMASGIALATKAVNPACKIILVEPEGKMLSQCLKGRYLYDVHNFFRFFTSYSLFSAFGIYIQRWAKKCSLGCENFLPLPAWKNKSTFWPISLLM